MNSPAEPALDTRDARQCMALVAALPLTKTGPVHQTLTGLLRALQSNPPPPLQTLELLEMARPAVAFVQEEMASRYAQRSLVPGSADEEVLQAVSGLWKLMCTAYAQVAQRGGDLPEVQERIALICQRCIHYAGKPVLEYFRARRELPPGLWIELHGYYSTAEEWGIAAQPVAEPLNEFSRTQSCAQAYAATLLVDLGNPYSRPPREFVWLARWSQRFSVFCEVAEVEADCDGRLYAAHLMQDRGLRPLELLGRDKNLRRLDTRRLMAEMHEVVRGLKRQRAPAELGLGETVFEPAASRLLVSLYRPWCLASSPRRFQRRAASGTAQLAYGFEAIHYFVTGSEFIQPPHVRIYSRAEFEEIVTFRHRVDPTERLHVKAAQIEYQPEAWEVLDQSVNGFRLYRRGQGERVEHGQLLGIRPPDGDSYLLAEVSWLMYGRDGTLTAGVHVLPGVPDGIRVRAAGPSTSQSERYIRAFVLPDMPALKEPASLVLPKGWHQPSRVLDLYVERSMDVRLEDVLTQGLDFDRVSFAALRLPHS